jgi:hypothetical protein
VPPLPFFDDRATAHPLASLMQPIRRGPRVCWTAVTTS